MNAFLDCVVQAGPDMAVRATLLLVAACGLSLALKKGSAAQRHLVWTAGLAGSLALPVIHFSVPEWRVWPTVMAERSGATTSREDGILGDWAYSSATEAVPSNVPWEAGQAAPRTDSPTVAKEAGFARTMPVGQCLAALWLAGVLCGCARLALAFARLRQLARRADPATGRVASLVTELARATGIRRPVQCLVSQEPVVPMTWGWVRPVLLLPAEAGSWSIERLRVVLQHELAHVRRGDFATQLVSELARSLYWFHPLSWWSVRRLRIEQEAACDDCVLAAGATADDYAEELLAVTARLPHGWQGAGVALAMGRASRIENRVRSILADDRDRRPVGAWRLARVASLFATLATVTAIIGPAAVAEDVPASPPVKPAATAVANASGDTDAITELTPEAARKLAVEFPGVKVEIEVAGRKVLRSPRGLPLNGLKTLDAEAAKALAAYGQGRDTDSLFLHGLATLSPEAAQGLAEFKGWQLSLDGLTMLSGETAKGLAKSKGNGLSLNGLTTISPEAAESLAEFKGFDLGLSGLTTLSDESAKALAGFAGGGLWLKGLTKLSDEAAKALRAKRGVHLPDKFAQDIKTPPAKTGRLADPDDGRRQAAPEEEDVAFFEKKYQKKITGVKPKGEYSDPDQFYSAIGEQLGIPEIAWKAAAEKYGWKKDDGKQTFTMLKGGPTSDGGQGTWDVLFIRSKINPETKRPDPAAAEPVMVQLDYDGNFKIFVRADKIDNNTETWEIKASGNVRTLAPVVQPAAPVTTPGKAAAK